MTQTFTINNYRLRSWNEFYAGKHWASRKRLADEVHFIVKMEVKRVEISPIKNYPVSIDFEVGYSDNRRHDPDNCAVKFLTDGLVEAGILADDSWKFVGEIRVKVAGGTKADYIKITLNERSECMGARDDVGWRRGEIVLCSSNLK